MSLQGDRALLCMMQGTDLPGLFSPCSSTIQEVKRVQPRGPNTLSPVQSPTDSLVSSAEGLAMLGGICHRDGLDVSRAVPAQHQQRRRLSPTHGTRLGVPRLT